MSRHFSHQKGFSLLELGIVLMVITLLFSSLMPAFSAYRQIAEIQEARQQLAMINETLVGFAARHGRLPCPAAPGAYGIESPENGGACTHPWNGLLPGSTLGLQPQDEHGYVLDPWGNPLRYAISTFSAVSCGNAPCLSREDGIRSIWNSETPPQPDLRICQTASGQTGHGGSAECTSGSALTKDAVAIIFSLGRNGNQRTTGSDETANIDNDRLFVSHDPTLSLEEFDDQLSWISSNIFYSRLISAGRLP